MPNLALAIKNPEFDMAGAVRQGQEAQAGAVTNQLQALDAREKTGQANALNDYRTGVKAGDKNAINKLNAYPEIQAQIHDALKKMAPDKVQAAVDKANAFGDAAKYVGSFAPGTPERDAAWGKAIDDLAKNGHIDQAQAAYWKKSGPSDVLLQQALTVKDVVGNYAKQAAEAEATADLSPKDLLDIEGKVQDFNQHFFPAGKIGINDQEIKARDQAVQDYKNTLIAQMRDAKAKTTPKPGTTLGVNGPNTATKPAPKSNVLDITPKGAAGAPAGALPPDGTKTSAPAAAGAVAGPAKGYNLYSSTPVGQQGTTKPPAEPAPATLKEWKPGKPLPATHANAVKITGSVDEQKAQLQKLPPGTPVVLPDGTPTYRK